MHNPMDLTGRTVLVTGASSGIGRETAILLSSLNARVVLAGRDHTRLEETLKAMGGLDHRVKAFDLSSTGEIAGAMKAIVMETGPLSGIVHAAGLHLAKPVRLLQAEEIDRIMKVNVQSALLLIRAFCQKGCFEASGASIVLLSSVAAVAGQPALSAYGATKAALMGIVKSVAMELARSRIRVNCIAPGMVRSEMTEHLLSMLLPEQVSAIEQMHPLGFGTTRDVAHAAAFLLADTGRWITGSTLLVDGGYTAH